MAKANFYRHDEATVQRRLERSTRKQKYGQLTDDDLAFAEGKEDELLGGLQQKLDKSKEDLRREIESL